MTICLVTLQSSADAEWMVVRTSPWSSGCSSNSAIVWLQSRSLTTCLHLQSVAKHSAITWILFVTFTVAGVSLPYLHPPPDHLHFCHTGHLCILVHSLQPSLCLPCNSWPTCTLSNPHSASCISLPKFSPLRILPDPGSPSLAPSQILSPILEHFLTDNASHTPSSTLIS